MHLFMSIKTVYISEFKKYSLKYKMNFGVVLICTDKGIFPKCQTVPFRAAVIT